MKTLKILTAAVFATFAVAAYAAPFGPAGAGCPSGAAPGSAGCPNYGAGPGAGYGPGQRGAAFQERLQAADTNADGRISREEAQAALPRLFERFDLIDANHDGFVTVEEMQAARLAHRGAGRGEGWKQWDANGDGRLSREEVATAPRLSQQFDAIDANHDGFVTVEELQAAHAAYRGAGHGRGQGWTKWDANGDGRLSREEVANAPLLSQQFDAIDANHDGFLTVEELQAARGQFAGRGPNRGS